MLSEDEGHPHIHHPTAVGQSTRVVPAALGGQRRSKAAKLRRCQENMRTWKRFAKSRSIT